MRIMFNTTDIRRLWLTVALGAIALGVWSAPVSSAALSARAARSLNVADEAHLHVVHTNGELLIEEGPATGALPGTVRARFRVGSQVTGTFTIYPHGGGSITGQGSARLHSTGTYASFAGTATVNYGTGRYRHAHGHGGFYGIVNRHTNALVVQTTGRLTY
jgi:hypothetical protein